MHRVGPVLDASQTAGRSAKSLDLLRRRRKKNLCNPRLPSYENASTQKLRAALAVSGGKTQLQSHLDGVRIIHK
jgi:transcriptional regulator NrdR family protein